MSTSESAKKCWTNPEYVKNWRESMEPVWEKKRGKTIEHREAIIAGSRSRTDARAPMYSDERVREIRELIADGMSVGDISRKLGIHRAPIYFLKAGKTYKHVV